MKKIITVMLLGAVLMTPAISQAEGSLLQAWKQWVLMRKAISSQTIENNKVEIPEIKKEEEVKVIIPQVQEATAGKLKNILTRRYSMPSYTRTPVASSKMKLRAQVSATKPTKSIHTITNEPIKVFEVGVRLDFPSSSTKFQEALLLDTIKFRLFRNTGMVKDVEGVELMINGEAVSFNSDGLVFVQLHGARVPARGVFSFDVSLRIKDPAMTPHIAGEMMLRIESMTAYGESSQKKETVFLYGATTSNKIEIDPIPYVNSGQSSEIVLRDVTTIYGRTLDEGEKAFVLVGQFTANYDDLYLRGATLRNTLTGSNIDSLIAEIIAVNLETGVILDRTRFTGGVAKFEFKPNVFAGRGEDVQVGFQVTIQNPLNRSQLDSRFKLELAPADLVVQSATTGNILGNNFKYFNIDSEEFAIAKGQMVISPSSKQQSFAVGTNRPETVFRFTVGGDGDVALGRLSFDIYSSGMEFRGGSLSADDVALVVIKGNREYEESVTVSATGNKIVLDFPNSYRIWDDVVEFGLKVALNDLSGNNDSDLVSVRFLGDSVFQQGTLSDVRTSGAAFIWSDLSARAHSLMTLDWFSGYRVSGLPGNTTVVKRFE